MISTKYAHIRNRALKCYKQLCLINNVTRNLEFFLHYASHILIMNMYYFIIQGEKQYTSFNLKRIRFGPPCFLQSEKETQKIHIYFKQKNKVNIHFSFFCLYIFSLPFLIFFLPLIISLLHGSKIHAEIEQGFHNILFYCCKSYLRLILS